jgi:DNA-binding CsgD family transcriptional regulator
VRRSLPLESFESDFHPVVVSDAKGVVCFCNKAAGSLLKVDPDGAVGRPCWEVVRLRTADGEPLCSSDCPVQEQARSGRLEPTRRAVSRAKGRAPLELEILTFLVPQERGAAQGVIHLFRTIRQGRNVAADEDASPSHVTKEDLGLLSPRELEVLKALARGADTSEVAASLSICQATVRNHIEAILHKLGVHRRLEAILKLIHKEENPRPPD